MKSVLGVLALAAAIVAASAFAQSEWPSRPVRYIVPLAPGGTADGVARVMAERLSALWRMQVLVENRAGGNTIIGTEAIARAAPDGYTIGMGIITSQAANPFLYPKLAYDVEKDFTPIVLIATSPVFLIVHPSVPAKNLQEFLAYAKSNPGKLSFASTGFGSSFHIATEMLMQRTGIQMVHVPYKGMGSAVADLLSGNVQLAIDVSTMAQVRQGKLRALGVVDTVRFDGAPDVPSFAEQGLPDFAFYTWLTLHAPAGLPHELRQRINADVNKVLAMPDVRERFAKMSYVAHGGSPEQLSAFLADERVKIGRIIREGRIEPQ